MRHVHNNRKMSLHIQMRGGAWVEQDSGHDV